MSYDEKKRKEIIALRIKIHELKNEESALLHEFQANCKHESVAHLDQPGPSRVCIICGLEETNQDLQFKILVSTPVRVVSSKAKLLWYQNLLPLTMAPVPFDAQ